MLLNRSKLLSDPQRLGRWGEKHCERFLKRKGLKTLTCNFACRTGEIDLIMVASDMTIVFVEVRTRSDESFGPPDSSITHAKRNRLLRTARHFLATNNIENRPFRFDIVAIVLGQAGRPKLEHYKNTFVP